MRADGRAASAEVFQESDFEVGDACELSAGGEQGGGEQGGGEQGGGAGADGGGHSQGVRGAKAMEGTEAGGGIGDGEVRRHSLQVWEDGQQAEVLVDAPLLGLTVGVDKKLGPGERGRDGGVGLAFQPGEDRRGQIGAGGVGFQVADEDAGVEGDAAVSGEEGAQGGGHSQLSRSCWRSFSGDGLWARPRVALVQEAGRGRMTSVHEGRGPHPLATHA